MKSKLFHKAFSPSNIPESEVEEKNLEPANQLTKKNPQNTHKKPPSNPK